MTRRTRRRRRKRRTAQVLDMNCGLEATHRKHERDEVEEGDVSEEHGDVDPGVAVQLEVALRRLDQSAVRTHHEAR